MSNKIITVDGCGHTGTLPIEDLFYNHDFQNELIEFLKREVNTPNSEFIQILRQAMNIIADEEVEKVLK